MSNLPLGRIDLPPSSQAADFETWRAAREAEIKMTPKTTPSNLPRLMTLRMMLELYELTPNVEEYDIRTNGMVTRGSRIEGLKKAIKDLE